MQAIYKCRMCGEEVLGKTLPEKEVNLCLAIFIGKGYRYGSPDDYDKIHIHIKHRHSDGSIGFADFIGFREENNGRE